MGIGERAVHINNLIALKDFCNNNGVFTLASNIEQSLDYAISSLKTDLKYDLMYEGENVYTKADMAAMLNDLADEISSLTMDNDPLDIADYIREKINTLKENTDGNK